MSRIIDGLMKRGISEEQAKIIFLDGWGVISQLISEQKFTEAEDAFFEIFGLEINYLLDEI